MPEREMPPQVYVMLRQSRVRNQVRN
jgi:hypothetical protein